MKPGILFTLGLVGWVGSAVAADSQSLFDGKTLDGWTGDPKLWSVQDGVITGQTTAEHPIKVNTFLIWTNPLPADFELKCQFKISGGNSGIQYRSRILDPKAWVAGGYQADIEAGTNYTGILYEERMTRGIMALRGEKVVWNAESKKQVVGSVGTVAEIQGAIRRTDWNDYVIRAKGNHLQHFINGKQTIDVVDETPGKQATNGVVALQLHVGPPMMVQFKNLQITPLK